MGCPGKAVTHTSANRVYSDENGEDIPRYPTS